MDELAAPQISKSAIRLDYDPATLRPITITEVIGYGVSTIAAGVGAYICARFAYESNIEEWYVGSLLCASAGMGLAWLGRQRAKGLDSYLS